jgi:hypothetical protein
VTAAERDPTKIREGLSTVKRRGIPFDTAWTFVAGPPPQKGKGRTGPYDDAMSERAFMHLHFRAAYLNLPTANGRFPAPDAGRGRDVRPRLPVLLHMYDMAEAA